jgi:outer membrane protein TolC
MSLGHPRFLSVFLILVLFSGFFRPKPGYARSGEKPDTTDYSVHPIIPRMDTENAFTESQIIELSLKKSRKLESLGTNVDIAGHRLASSGWIENPELRLSDVSTRYLADRKEELQIGLRLRFPELGELVEERQQSRVDLWERKVEEIRYRHELIARVRNSVADVILYDRLAELDGKRVEMEKMRIRTIEEMVDVTGDRSIVYYTKAKIRNAESKNDYARSLQNQGLARRKLAKRSGIAVDAELVVENLPEIDKELDTLVAVAVKNRPEINLVQQSIDLAIRQRRMETMKLIPWPTFVELSYHLEKKNKDDWDWGEKRKEEWGEFRMGINLPIFNLNLGNIRATRLAVTKKENQYDAIRESIEEEVRDAYIIYKDLSLDWKNLDRDATILIANAEAVVREAKTHQTLMADEVYEMEWNILDLQRLLAEKRCELAHALSDLYFVLGIERHEQLMTDKD